MGAIVQAIQIIINKIGAVLGWIGSLIVEVFKSAWEMLTDAACWVFDQGLSIVESAVNSLDVSGVSTHLGAMGSIPASVLEVMSALGMGTAFAIVAAALTIRFILQLIPFVRLGS